jgi:hypothetical protein
MKMNGLVNSSKLFMKRNSATILTCIGGAGVIATSVMAVKATPKALLLLEEAEREKGEDLTKFEKTMVAGPAYIPSVLVGASTIACIFGANALNKRQQAALTSAYMLIENSYKEYRNKVKELYGGEADAEVKNDIAKDKYEDSDIARVVDKELFYDEFSGRFFNSTLEEVQRAQYAINRDLVMQSYATINDFYDYLKIPPVDYGDEMGWTPAMNEQDYWQEWIDFSNLKMVDDDGLEYYIIRMYQEPRLGFVDM